MYNQQIETFIKVVDCGSLSKAGEKLFMSAVSVMKQINALEEHIGVKLLKRTNQGVFLTEAGKSIYDDAKKIIRASNNYIEKARNIAKKEKIVIKVGTSLLRSCKPLIRLLEKTDEASLSFQIQIVPFGDDPISVKNTLSSLGKDIDCFVGPCDSIEWRNKYSINQLGTYKCCATLSRGHKLAKKNILKLEDLYNENLILVKNGDSQTLNIMRNEIEISHPEITIIDTPNFYDTEIFNKCNQMNYIMETLDIWAEVHPSLITIPVEWDYEMPYGIIYSKTPSKSMLDFIEKINFIKNLE